MESRQPGVQATGTGQIHRSSLPTSLWPWWPLDPRLQCFFATISGEWLVLCVKIALRCFSAHECKAGSWGYLAFVLGQDFTLERNSLLDSPGCIRWNCLSTFLGLLSEGTLSPFSVSSSCFLLFAHGYFFSFSLDGTEGTEPVPSEYQTWKTDKLSWH